jgi:hypothetical protein
MGDSNNLGLGTMTGEHDKPEFDSTNTKIHGEPPAGSPLPGVEREEPAEVKGEINPNTE